MYLSDLVFMSEIYHCSTHEKMCVLHELLSWCASFSCGVNADENHRSVSFIGKYLVVKLLEFQYIRLGPE